LNFTVPTETRCEIKFVASELEYHRLLNWVKQHSACFYEEYPGRQVNNIYFDSLDFQSYRDNISGASSRLKVRYRWYGSSVHPAQGALEIKCKRNQYSWKLIYEIKEILGPKEKNWRQIRKILSRHLPSEAKKWLDIHPVPILLNRYRRKYFRCKYENVRVTLDTNISVYDQTRKPYPNYSFQTNMPRIFVVEVKFPRELRNKASEIIRDIPIRVSRHSKYICGFSSINGS
jgi:SPX domain protein involved in polyphosphate accumulation